MTGRSERPGPSKSLLIVGCGDIGLRLAARLGLQWRIWGLRRDSSCLPEGVEGLDGDYTSVDSLGALQALRPDFVVTSLKPSGRDAQAYQRGFANATANVLAALGDHRPRAMLMISSTRVYAEREGGWVDEDSPLALDEPEAAAIIEAEQRVLAAPCPAAVLRCGGIYGSSRSRLLERVASGHICAPEPRRYGNRIHRDDVAGALQHLLALVQAGEALAPVYLGVDGEAAAQQEVERWLALRLGVQVEADYPPPRTHKRCRGQALEASGYRLQHAGYRSGYEALLRARDA